MCTLQCAHFTNDEHLCWRYTVPSSQPNLYSTNRWRMKDPLYKCCICVLSLPLDERLSLNQSSSVPFSMPEDQSSSASAHDDDSAAMQCLDSPLDLSVCNKHKKKSKSSAEVSRSSLKKPRASNDPKKNTRKKMTSIASLSAQDDSVQVLMASASRWCMQR
jgi:hypothetical protein